MSQVMSCTEYFVRKQPWMIYGFDNRHEKQGFLYCPTSTCRLRIGIFSLSNLGEDGVDNGGIKCSCDTLVSPGFLVYKSKTKATF